ncbi:hypothetical protein FQN55_008809 [Onygenales sp. PD_40]|nr:hypothetical protein FQN55_008809 [Onygenales sp. PD_40]
MPPLQSLSLYDNHDDDLIEVPIDTTFSDGDRSIWPTHPRFERADPKLYLLKLADMWMKERGEAKKG